MKRFRSALFWLVVIGVVWVQREGCNEPQTQRSSVAPRATAQPAGARLPGLAGVQRLPIPIDDTRPGAQALLTRNFYFIFDGSGSMNDGPDNTCKRDVKFTRKIDGAKWAVREFLKLVPADINLGLYVFDSRGESEVLPLAPAQRAVFVKAIDAVAGGGGTPLAQAIRTGTDRLVRQYQQQLGYGEFRLIVVTDGIADHIPEAATYAAQHGMPIYAIGLCIGNAHPLRQYAVSYRAADSFADLAAGLEGTLAELPAFDATVFDK